MVRHTGGMSTGIRPRGRPPRYDFGDLLDVVVRVFNERGYEATSMEDLSRATGMTKSAFYHHVSGKEQLLGLAVHRALDGLALVLEEPAARQGTPVERLEHVLRRTVQVLVAELPYVTLLLRLRGNTDTEREALARRRELDTRVAALVAEAAEAGEIRADVDPRLVTRLLFGMVNSVTEWYRPERGTGLEEVVVALAMDALRARR
jgi:AcrR family transcriptional regulator